MDFEHENSDTEIGAADIQYTNYGVVCADGIERVSDAEYYDE